jgi:hypothetical protein
VGLSRCLRAWARSSALEVGGGHRPFGERTTALFWHR